LKTYKNKRRKKMKKNRIFLSICLACIILLSSCSTNNLKENMYNANNFYVEQEADIVEGTTIVENPFIATAETSVSTLSADVDTASYTFLRKLINNRYTLSEIQASYGKYLRTEEMINYFDYLYEQPEGSELFGVSASASVCPWNSESVLLTVGLSTQEAVERSANNLVFLIDVSGSMSADDKLKLLKDSFSYLIDNLGDDDIISIVTYSGKEEIVLEGCSASKKLKILSAVKSLSSSGSTNGEAGLKKAYVLAEKYYIENGNNRIIMASDGDLNVGMSSAEELKEYVIRKKESGVYLSVLGFGTGNFHDANMEAIADNGNGVYYYIDGETEAEKVFGDDLISTLYAVANDVKLQITFNSNFVSSYRLIGYENRVMTQEEFDDDTKDAGEIGAGHTVTVCYELKMNGEYLQDSDWLTLDVRYFKTGETTAHQDSYTVGSSSYTKIPDKDFIFVASVIRTAMIVRESKYSTDDSIGKVISTLNDIELNDEYKKEFLELLKKLD